MRHLYLQAILNGIKIFSEFVDNLLHDKNYISATSTSKSEEGKQTLRTRTLKASL